MGRTAKDLTGRVVGRLVVIKCAGSKYGYALWQCQCICGQVIEICSRSLISGKSQSCGCLRSEIMSKRKGWNFKHGKGNTSIYYRWFNMKRRCNDPTNKSYGGRGIKVCKRWEDSFENFYADMGDPPRNTTLDRIDNNGNYEPGNCRWSTRKEQNNNRRNNALITYQGRTQTLQSWADEYGIDHRKLWERINKFKWAIVKALNQK